MDGAERRDDARAEQVTGEHASDRRSLGPELVPRGEVLTHEAEVLVRAVAAWLGARHAPADPWVVDARCGSARLACTLAVSLPAARIWACDRDEEAVRHAERNVEALGIEHRVQVRRGDLHAALSELRLEGRIHAVVCSTPPGTADDAWCALQSRLLEQAAELLRLGGRAYVEVDPLRHRRLHAIARAHASYEWLDFARDDAGSPCAAILRRVAARHGPRIPRHEACAMRSESTFVTTRPRG
jgi:release factor glutamine methyltransferase